MSITHPSFGKLDDDRIIIFDTTLRDGEQSPGFSMNLHEKIRMAEARLRKCESDRRNRRPTRRQSGHLRPGALRP
jgi:HMGL-like